MNRFFAFAGLLFALIFVGYLPAHSSAQDKQASATVSKPAAIPPAPEAGCLTQGYPADGQSDDVTVGNWVAEEHDSSGPTEKHYFGSFPASPSNILHLGGDAIMGTRGYRCVDSPYQVAIDEARRVAMSWKIEHPAHDVKWNNQPVVLDATTAPAQGCTIVNPNDGVLVVLSAGHYVVESWDNRQVPAVHMFEALSVSSYSVNNWVHALPQIGWRGRAWKCANAATALSEAIRIGYGYQTSHPGEMVTHPGQVRLPLLMR